MVQREEFFKALSDDNRRRILKMLEDKPLCVSEIAKSFRVSQPTTSHHLDILKRAGLVGSERRGQKIYYHMKASWFLDCCSDFLSMFNCCSDFLKSSEILRKSKKTTRAAKINLGEKNGKRKY